MHLRRAPHPGPGTGGAGAHGPTLGRTTRFVRPRCPPPFPCKVEAIGPARMWSGPGAAACRRASRGHVYGVLDRPAHRHCGCCGPCRGTHHAGRSGPYCLTGRIHYPYSGAASYVPRDCLWIYPALPAPVAFVLLAACIHASTPVRRLRTAHSALCLSDVAAGILGGALNLLLLVALAAVYRNTLDVRFEMLSLVLSCQVPLPVGVLSCRSFPPLEAPGKSSG